MGTVEELEDRFQAGRYAAIDIGTVTCRMLVADVDDSGRLRELDREYAITNLGEDVDATGSLKPEAMQRVADVVARFLDVLRGFATSEHPRIRMTAMATSAARDARNASEFEALLAKLGVTLSVIPGEREAALSFAGASCDFPGERLLVVDIGGGSTEVIAGRAGGAPDRVHSFNIGCRRVTEKFFAADPPSAVELERARAWVGEGMRPYFDELRGAGFAPQRLVAVAGTATTVVSIQERMEVYDTSRVHKAVITRPVLDGVAARLEGVPLVQRERIVGLDPGRAPVIVAGMVILQTVLDLAGVDSFTVSESDILHGIILDEAARSAV
ncbi:Ppx/GppA family phosphatase [Eggerthella lenta]|uniref:Ppx/GppA family phosphatase n=1 Tax=Eggerthella lenta TaxID=84112 RepID=A0A5C5BRY1_EGGLN|nr:Ppx/GppA phosphatase family protein [Eggerthella lenta]TNU88681.1 Ppx/GppA family phosphatase [Eggerthella lenta]